MSGLLHIGDRDSSRSTLVVTSERIISDRQLISYGIVATYSGVSVFFAVS